MTCQHYNIRTGCGPPAFVRGGTAIKRSAAKLRGRLSMGGWRANSNTAMPIADAMSLALVVEAFGLKHHRAASFLQLPPVLRLWRVWRWRMVRHAWACVYVCVCDLL
jgi:hypothetical protein